MPLDQTKKQNANLFVYILCSESNNPCRAFDGTTSYASSFQNHHAISFEVYMAIFSNMSHNSDGG